jgi:predicted transcriptional regulator of viral defense system
MNLIKYAQIFPVKSVQKRIGFILDQCLTDEKLLDPLQKKIKNTSLVTLYASTSRKGIIDNKWKVIIDAPSE